MSTIEDLRKEYPNNFWTNLRDEEFIRLYGEDLISSDTVGESNVECIERDYEWAEILYHPYSRQVYTRVDDLIQNLEEDGPDKPWVEEVYDLLRALEDYPIYDDSDFSERENKALMEYVEHSLAWDLCYELDNRTDECEDRIQDWISNNMDTVWECYDGSVDDQPINVTELAKELPSGIVESA